ncbi:Bcl-2-like protein 1 [Liparis tanakae]|uniref:Bcl-2-like protein 1 n=1 Tax=Liparis tanakae TaxID=230148 RepID=A0A4Z2FNX2_9TELE|nr:Bcl-2-like protein 1 [Liparis tanakae]
MTENRELVVFYINYKLSQRNYPLAHMGLTEPLNRTDGGGAGEEQRGAETHGNGTFNGTSPGTPPAAAAASSPRPQRLPSTTTNLDAVKEALRDSANEFELRYARAFSDLHNQLHITPATAYQSFENVMDEVFRDGVNWGRIVGLFAFGGALCVECVEKEMSPLNGNDNDIKLNKTIRGSSVLLEDARRVYEGELRSGGSNRNLAVSMSACSTVKNLLDEPTGPSPALEEYFTSMDLMRVYKCQCPQQALRTDCDPILRIAFKRFRDSL